MPLWFASLDLRQAFDRVNWQPLFESLHDMGLGVEYQHLLALLYDNQQGVLRKGEAFKISRGVRQGDVLSPLLFNGALDVVIKRWKRHLRNNGIKLQPGPDSERLTNVHFADDLVIYAASLPELT